MEKIPLSIRVPVLDLTLDFIIPSTMAMKEIRMLVSDILCSEYGVKSESDKIDFIDYADGRALIMEASLSQMGIGDGAKLLLV